MATRKRRKPRMTRNDICAYFFQSGAYICIMTTEKKKRERERETEKLECKEEKKCCTCFRFSVLDVIAYN